MATVKITRLCSHPACDVRLSVDPECSKRSWIPEELDCQKHIQECRFILERRNVKSMLRLAFQMFVAAIRMLFAPKFDVEKHLRQRISKDYMGVPGSILKKNRVVYSEKTIQSMLQAIRKKS